MKQNHKEKLNPKIKYVARNLEWDVKEYDDGVVRFGKYSLTGKRFSFTVNVKGAAREIYEYYDRFDVDNYVAMWIEMKKKGISGVPSARRLVEDAEAISEMLKELARAVLSI